MRNGIFFYIYFKFRYTMKSSLSLLLVCLVCLSFKTISVADDVPLWLRYPAISPDGKNIVFCYKGDIFKVETGGGTAQQLTSSEAHEVMPVWSPDGKWIAFASDRHGNFDVFVVPAEGGNSKRLTYYSTADVPNCFSPDNSEVFYSSTRIDIHTSLHSPASRLPELYKVSVKGGREKMVFSHPAEELKINASGDKYLFIDKKGNEDTWRKHHTSSVTRDIWIYDKKADTYKKISGFEGEDRNPNWNPSESSIYYLSEKSGSFNVWKMLIDDPSTAEQMTKFEKNPVRFLTVSADETMCFAYDGELFTQKGKEKAVKVKINIVTDERFTAEKNEVYTTGVSEMEVSPDGKEVVFTVRGEVYVSSVEGGMTKRITDTPGMERSVSFSPDGRSVLYASERNKKWGIFQSTLVRGDEKHFFNSTILKEEAIVVNDKENFQPRYSPNGEEIAYLEDRTGVKICNLKTKQIREILPKEKSYSYTDGDQWFDWSPDGKYLFVNYLEENQWLTEIGLCDASGKQPMVNISKSGYDSAVPKWMMDGKLVIYQTNRHGMKNQASHGWQSDVYGMFLSKEAYDKFKLNKAEYAELKDKESEKEKEKEKNKKPETDKKKTETEKKLPEVKLELENLEDRRVRLTVHSSELGDAVVSKDGEQLFYLAKFEKGFDLWVHKFRDNETKMLVKLGAHSVSNIAMDKEGKNLYFVVDAGMVKINTENSERKDIQFKAEMNYRPWLEREEMFEHAWRQAREKFYVSDLQKTDWNYYKNVYAKFLPHINNNYDFAELLSEMLGELNASHTGGRYFPQHKGGDETAALGVFYDENYNGKGMKVAEVIDNGPFNNATSQVKSGSIIEKIDGVEIDENDNIYPLLNRKSGKNVLIALYDPATKKRWEEVIKPITLGEQNELLYKRWIKNLQKETDRLSNGKVGYVHVRAMNDEGFRAAYEQALGYYSNRKALIVDTRYNGGGWLHDDLVTFLSGKDYITFVPRERKIGHDPGRKWVGKSCVLMSEGNYSDAHMFPYAYKALNIGKLIGMPVPGTGTAVWWETLWNGTIIFGIPQVGVVGLDGKYLENQQLEPDIKVENGYKEINNKRDQQLERAVEEMLKEIGE